MNRFRSFMRDKGFYLALLACILAAAVSSFWAIRSMMQRLGNENEQQQGLQEETPWEAPDMNVEQNVKDVPVQPTPSAGPQQPSSSQSGQPTQPQQAQGSGEDAGQAAASFVQPVSGQISAEYSGDELVYNETLGDWRTHNGVDITCAADATVKACMAGKVTAVYEDGNWGQVVEVDSDGVTFRYVGLAASPAVEAGESVSAGQKLGMIGEVQCESAAGTHLHFEALKGGVYQDPMKYLG